MKKLLGLLLVVSMFACKNVDQYKAGIEGLTTKWDAASAAITEVTSMVAGSKAAHMAAFDSLKIDSTFLTKVKPADLGKIKTAIEAYKTSGSGFDGIATTLSELKTAWDTKGAEVAALKDGLANGKLDGDVAAKITELTNFITTSEGQLTSVKDSVAKTSEGATTALQALKTAAASYLMKK